MLTFRNRPRYIPSRSTWIYAEGVAVDRFVSALLSPGNEIGVICNCVHGVILGSRSELGESP